MPSKRSEREAVFACQPSSVQIELSLFHGQSPAFGGLYQSTGLGNVPVIPIFRLNSRAFRI
jgi:hypothetical protein